MITSSLGLPFGRDGSEIGCIVCGAKPGSNRRSGCQTDGGGERGLVAPLVFKTSGTGTPRPVGFDSCRLPPIATATSGRDDLHGIPFTARGCSTACRRSASAPAVVVDARAVRPAPERPDRHGPPQSCAFSNVNVRKRATLNGGEPGARGVRPREVAGAGVGRRVTELAHRPSLDLADALTGEVEVLPHLFQRARFVRHGRARSAGPGSGARARRAPRAASRSRPGRSAVASTSNGDSAERSSTMSPSSASPAPPAAAPTTRAARRRTAAPR